MTPDDEPGCEDAVLLVDVINDMAFEGAETLRKPALAAARKLAELAERARRARVPVVYANDNFGRWRSDFRATIERCLNEGKGQRIVHLLAPREGDYFVLKPKMSAFFATPLSLLLARLGTKRLVIGGFAADACVYATACDAHAHELEVVVPTDVVAAESTARKTWALKQMRELFHVKTPVAAHVRLRGTRRAAPLAR